MLYSFDGKEPSIGKDTYVSETALVIGDVVIGDNCYIGHGTILRGDYGRIEIGSKSAVEEGVVIHVGPNRLCKIGENVTMGHGAVIHCQSIGDMAVIGMGAVVSIRSRVGSWAIVAEGAVVKMNQEIPDMVVAAGNPAQVIRGVEERDMELWMKGKQVYIDLAAKYLK
ncbi:MAG TPA: gamma carbonic anhydrase family protein, partial [Verrucomicrobiae bacterium]|nr:gamma carbonic anhydrase family protein [Verrucomicrobiae bacterium]